jgi:hypothetical protein
MFFILLKLSIYKGVYNFIVQKHPIGMIDTLQGEYLSKTTPVGNQVRFIVMKDVKGVRFAIHLKYKPGVVVVGIQGKQDHRSGG